MQKRLVAAGRLTPRRCEDCAGEGQIFSWDVKGPALVECAACFGRGHFPPWRCVDTTFFQGARA